MLLVAIGVLLVTSSLSARMFGYEPMPWFAAQKTKQSGSQLGDYYDECTSLGYSGKDIPVSLGTACRRVYDFSKKSCESGDINGCKGFVGVNMSLSSNLKNEKTEGFAFPDVYVSLSGAYKVIQKLCDKDGDGFSCGYYAYVIQEDPSSFKMSDEAREDLYVEYLMKSCRKSDQFSPKEFERFRPCEMLYDKLSRKKFASRYGVTKKDLKKIKTRADVEYALALKYLSTIIEDPMIMRYSW